MIKNRPLNPEFEKLLTLHTKNCISKSKYKDFYYYDAHLTYWGWLNIKSNNINDIEDLMNNNHIYYFIPCKKHGADAYIIWVRDA